MASQLKCPICQNSEVSGWIDPRYNFCNVCKLVWLKKTPSLCYLKDYYAGSSRLISNLFKPISKIFYLIRESYVRGYKKSLWVDVGAGDGEFLRSVSAKRKIGVEISDSARFIMREKGLEVLSEKQFLATKGLKSDVISFWHVLEHLKDPEIYLKVARKNLKTKGVLIVGVPNIDSFEANIFGKYWFHLDPSHHIWHFSPNSLGYLLKKCGYKIVRTSYLSAEHNIAGILSSFINLSTGNINILHRLVKRKMGENLKVSLYEYFFIAFWIMGLPLVIFFWLISVLFKKSGTIIVVAACD